MAAFYTALMRRWMRRRRQLSVDDGRGGRPRWPACDGGLIARFCRVYGLDAGPNFADPHHGGGAPDKNVLFLSIRAIPVTRPCSIRAWRAAQNSLRRPARAQAADAGYQDSDQLECADDRGLAHAGQFWVKRAMLPPRRSVRIIYFRSPARTEAFRVCATRAKYPDFLTITPFWPALLALGRDDQARLLAKQCRRGSATSQGGFFFTDRNAEDLIVRQKVAPTAASSGNAVAAVVMLQLDQPRVAAETITAFAGQLQDLGESMSAMIEAALRYQRIGPLQIGGGEIPQQLSPQEQASAAVQIPHRWSNPNQLTCT